MSADGLWKKAMQVADKLYPNERAQINASARWEGAAAAAHYLFQKEQSDGTSNS